MPEPPSASAAENAASPDRLSLVLFSGAFDRVHYALTLAAAALAVNRPATLFFTMGATRALLAADEGGPGWRHLRETEDGRSPRTADESNTANGIGGFEELLSACAALGCRFMVCEMGLRSSGLDINRLRTDIEITPGGLVTFLDGISKTGPTIFI